VPAVGTFIDNAASDVPGYVATAGTAFADAVAGIAIEEPYYPASGPLPPEVSADPPEVGYWHLTLPEQLATALRADTVHQEGVTGAGVRVAMVDTGFAQHPFFTARGYRVEPTVLGPGTVEPKVDDNGHGTGESANIFAAAPGATLLPVKTASASGALVNVTAAFNAAAALQPHIITNSWGSSVPGPPLSAANQALAAAVAGAVAEGIGLHQRLHVARLPGPGRARRLRAGRHAAHRHVPHAAGPTRLRHRPRQRRRHPPAGRRDPAGRRLGRLQRHLGRRAPARRGVRAARRGHARRRSGAGARGAPTHRAGRHRRHQPPHLRARGRRRTG